MHPFCKYPRTTVLVLDNHRAHHAKDVVGWLGEKNYILHYLPPYSSELNPIERVWALMKRRWGQALTSEDFERRMIYLSKPLKDLQDEWDEDERGELMLTKR